MLNAEYFTTDLSRQIDQLGHGVCSVTVHLTDGTSYTVRNYHPDDAKGGYVMLQVYPGEGVTEETKA